MLSMEDILSARAALEAALSDTAVVSRLDPTTGLYIQVETTPCRIVPKRSVTRPSGGILQGVTLWNIHLSVGSQARVGDRLAVGSATYLVTGIDRGRSEPIELVAQANTVV